MVFRGSRIPQRPPPLATPELVLSDMFSKAENSYGFQTVALLSHCRCWQSVSGTSLSVFLQRHPAEQANTCAGVCELCLLPFYLK